MKFQRIYMQSCYIIDKFLLISGVLVVHCGDVDKLGKFDYRPHSQHVKDVCHARTFCCRVQCARTQAFSGFKSEGPKVVILRGSVSITQIWHDVIYIDFFVFECYWILSCWWNKVNFTIILIKFLCYFFLFTANVIKVL